MSTKRQFLLILLVSVGGSCFFHAMGWTLPWYDESNIERWEQITLACIAGIAFGFAALIWYLPREMKRRDRARNQAREWTRGDR